MLTTIKKYEDVQQKINRIFRSGLQMKILLSLGDGKKTLSDLRNITGSSSQTILPLIRKMETEYLIVSFKTEYCLTPSGKIVYSKVHDCIYTFDILRSQNNFFRNHFLEGIPPLYLERIGSIRNCKVICDTSDEIFQAYIQFLDIVKKARKISRITPTYVTGL